MRKIWIKSVDCDECGEHFDERPDTDVCSGCESTDAIVTRLTINIEEYNAYYDVARKANKLVDVAERAGLRSPEIDALDLALQKIGQEIGW